METSNLSSGITPEKLSIMKLSSLDHDRDFLSEPTTPTGLRKSLDMSSSMGSSRTLAHRTSRQVSRSSRRSSSFMNSHRNKMSHELTSKAETKFFALMELMASASREASSLKEFWGRIIAEREAFAQEREELMSRIDEITETIETKEQEQHHHGQELVERKKQVEKLLIELTTTHNMLADHKKKITERDAELHKVKHEIISIREIESTLRTEFEKYRSDFDGMQLRLTTITDERDHVREEAGRHHTELRNLTREHVELKSRYTETHTKLESSRKENLSLNDRIKIWATERDEWLHEKDRLQEELRKSKNRAEESSRELTELHERHLRSTRELTKVKEDYRLAEAERAELTDIIEHKNREIKVKSTGWDEAEERFADVNLKYEHVKRELVSIRENLRNLEFEKAELLETLERRTEEHRIVVVERDQLKDDLHEERNKGVDAHRQVVVLQESLRRTESTLSDIRTEVHTLTERIKLLDRERDEARNKNSHLIAELAELNQHINLLKVDITTITEARDHLKHELQQYKTRFEEIQETVTEYHDGSSELEFEIESLRTLLHDSRSDRERAVAALTSADRERDEWRSKYEEKCRQLERFEEEAAKVYHSSHALSRGEAHRSSSTRTRMVSSGTTINNSGSG